MILSVIIPTYNRLWSLPKAIASAMETNVETEVIVVNDGSTDGTLEWLANQKNLVVINQQNQGKDWAVNNALKIAKGKYIRFLDSDDWFLPFSSDKLVKKAEAENLDVVCAGYSLFKEDEAHEKDIQWTVCDDFIAQQLGECDSSHYSAYLFKKDFIADIPHRQEYGARDDRKFVIEVAFKNPRYGYIKELTLAHRLHQQDRLQKVNGLVETFTNLAMLNVFKKSLQFLEKTNQLTERRKKAPTLILWNLAHWIAKTHIQEGAEVANWVFELDPNFQIPEGGMMGMMYRKFGFVKTEKFLKLRRMLKYGL